MNYTSIVSAEQVVEHLDDPDWRFIDCRFDLNDVHAGLEKYKAGHIPNAVYADLDKDLSSPVTQSTGRHPLPDIAAISEKFGRWGIGPGIQVVVYDDAFGSYAGRLWWLLRWLGHKNVAVLNGGLTQWNRSQLPLSQKNSVAKPARFIANPDMSMIADTTIVEQSLTSPQIIVVDVRDADRYQGLREPIDKIAGHVPGALNLPWKTNLNENGLYLDKTELLSHYAQLIKSDASDSQSLVFMCGSGVTACHSLVALEYLDIQGAKLYPGSWSEWIRDPQHPIATTSD